MKDISVHTAVYRYDYYSVGGGLNRQTMQISKAADLPYIRISHEVSMMPNVF